MNYKTARIVKLLHLGLIVVEFDAGTPQAVTKVISIAEMSKFL